MKPLVLLLASLMVAPVAAQAKNCAAREAVVAKLTKVGEAQTGIGLAKQGSLLEIWSSPQTGTFTVVMTFTNGMSCIMSYGESWTTPLEGDLSQTAEPA